MMWKGILLSAVLASSAVMASDSTIVRFELTDSVKKLLKQNEFDVTGVNYNTNEIEALLTEDELKLITAQKTTIKFSFPQTLVRGPDARYFNPDKIENFLEEIHSKYPQITEIKSIGKTLEGRDILAIKISDNAQVDESEPSVLVNAMHHAREVMTPEIATDMIQYLTTNYGTDDKVTNWVNNSEIWVIPMFNLDGNNKMWLEDSYWRKNTRNGYGVDLNRNYPTGWNSCNGSSGSRMAQTYRGTAPASESETQAMMNFVSEINPVFNISYHSYSEIVIYPFGCRPNRTPTEEVVEVIGAEIGEKLNYKPGTAWELLYNADGGDIDWMYTEHQVIPYVIEVNSTYDGFHPNYDLMRDKTVLRNRAGWMHILDRLHGPSFSGKVENNDFNQIIVSKSGNSKITQIYRIKSDGTFHIILNPGTYNFTFKGQSTRIIRELNIKNKYVLNF